MYLFRKGEVKGVRRLEKPQFFKTPVLDQSRLWRDHQHRPGADVPTKGVPSFRKMRRSSVFSRGRHPALRWSHAFLSRQPLKGIAARGDERILPSAGPCDEGRNIPPAWA